MHRFSLADAFEAWKQYVEIIEATSPHPHHYLLEFVPGKDEIAGLRESVATLKKIIQT